MQTFTETPIMQTFGIKPGWLVGAALLSCSLSAYSQAQDTEKYPSQPIRLLVGFSPGGSADGAARLVAQHMSTSMGQTFIIENRVGASGIIASTALVRAAPDGYTLQLMVSGHATMAAMRTSLPYRTLEDFAWISTITKYPMVIAVAPDSPVKTLKDLVDTAKKRPGELSYASVGTGTAHHLIGEWINDLADVNTTHVPFKGGMAGMTEVMTHRVAFGVETITLVQPLIASGQLRGVAVTSPQPVAALPDVPTASQTFPGLEYESWLGLAAPAGTPPEIIARLNAEVRKALAQPDVQERFKTLGAEARASSPEEFRNMVADDIKKFTAIVNARNIARE